MWFQGRNLMDLKVNNISFRGPLDSFATSVLRVCDTNEVVNAVGLDIGAMVVPRTYYDTKARNKYAGGETFFREISGPVFSLSLTIKQILSHMLASSITDS